MAETLIGTSDADRQIVWDSMLFREVTIPQYFTRFHGDENSIVHVKKLFEVGPDGKKDKATFTMLMKASGSGVTSRQTLKGKEESISRYTQNIELEEYAHATKDAGPLDRRRPIWNMPREARIFLTNWGAEKIDELQFTAVQASPTRVYTPVQTAAYTSTPLASAKSALTAGSTLTPAFLSKVATVARTGAARSINPLRPIKVEGKNYLVALFHPDAVYDLFEDGTFMQARREAEVRGRDNPVFSDSVAIWRGIVIHEHENMNYGTDAGAGSDVNYSQGVLMGSQSLVFAWGERPKIVPEKDDYERKHGYSIQMILKTQKPVFNSKDYGSIGLVVARTKLSDA